MSQHTPALEGPPVTISRPTVAVAAAVLLSMLGSAGVSFGVAPDRDAFVTRQELELAIERHSAKPHDVTAGLIAAEGREHEDRAVQRSIEAISTRLDTIEQLLRERSTRTDGTLDDLEKRLRSLEGRGGQRRGTD